MIMSRFKGSGERLVTDKVSASQPRDRGYEPPHRCFPGKKNRQSLLSTPVSSRNGLRI